MGMRNRWTIPGLLLGAASALMFAFGGELFPEARLSHYLVTMAASGSGIFCLVRAMRA